MSTPEERYLARRGIAGGGNTASGPDTSTPEGRYLVRKGGYTRGPLDPRAALGTVGELAAKVTPGPVKDVVAAVGNFLGSRVSGVASSLADPLIRPAAYADMSGPYRAVLSAGKSLITGSPAAGVPPNLVEGLAELGFTESPISQAEAEAANYLAKGLPVGSLSRFATSPQGVAFAAESAVGVPMLNAAAKPVAALARGIANLEVPVAGNVLRTRALPGVKQASEFVSTGSSLPNEYRQGVQRVLRAAEGKADLAGYRRAKALSEFESLPVAAQDRIQTAIERGSVRFSLSPEEQAVANALTKEYATEVGQRQAVGLKRHELGAHLEPQEKIGNVQFTKRILTPEARTELGVKPYGTPISATQAAPGGLGTGRLARRVSDPTLTSEEINLARTEAGRPRAFLPVVEATVKGGAANDIRVMNARVVSNLARKYGKPTDDPSVSIGRHFGVKTGFSEGRQKLLEGRALPKEIDELVSNLNKRTSPEEFGKLKRFWRGMNSQFKTWALFSPGFVSRNMQNNMLQTAIYGNLDPRTWTSAFKIRDAMQTGKGLDETVRIGRAAVRVGDYIDDSIKRGVIGRGQVAQETASALTSPGRARAQRIATAPFRAVRDVNQFGEDASRISFDLFNQDKGMSAVQSAERVDQVLFNYSNKLASPARSKLRRNFVPFINWDAQIGPLFARTALERPGQLGALANVRQRQNEAMGFPTSQDIALLGPDVEQGGGMVTKAGNGKVRATIPQAFGGYSINETVGRALQGPEEAANALATKLYPQFGLTFGFAAGRDPLTGRDFTGRPTTAPSALKALWLMPGGKEFAARHGIFIEPETGTIKAPDKLAYVLRAIPPVRLPSVLADMVAPGRDSETRVKSFLTGIREVEREPAVGARIRASEAQKGQREKRSLQRRYPEDVRKAGYKP